MKPAHLRTRPLRKAGLNWRRLVAAALLVLSGCRGSDVERIELSGTVVCDGVPVEYGIVQFLPVEQGAGPAMSTVNAVIQDGEYAVTAEGGLRLGSYQVLVEALERTGRQIETSTGFETALTDDRVRISRDDYASTDSPLVLDLQADSERRFDIEVPGR